MKIISKFKKISLCVLVACALAFVGAAVLLAGTANISKGGAKVSAAEEDIEVWNGTTATAFAGGNGTSTNPYEISNGEQLAYLAGLINQTLGAALSDEYEAYNNSDVYYVLTNDIYLNDTEGWESWGNESFDDENLNPWTPIGDYNIYSSFFSANFSGNGHAVKGIYIDTDFFDYQGLFGYIYDGNIGYTGVEQSYIKGNSNIGGIVGFTNGSACIENCYNAGAVMGISNTGGIAGVVHCSIMSCYNVGAVTGIENTGGVAGFIGKDGKVINCYNTGSVTVKGNNNYTGGVAGEVHGSITNCYNVGSVTGGIYVGGVVGLILEGNVENCYNTCDVIGNRYVGGVIGRINLGKVTNCYNTGAVTGTVTHVFSSTGGIAGDVIGGIIKNCYNTGNIEGKGQYTGGITGELSSGGIVENCYNTGDVSGSSYVGGVAGQVGGIPSGILKNCYFLKIAGGINSSLNAIGWTFGEATTAEFDGDGIITKVNGISGITINETPLLTALNTWVDGDDNNPDDLYSHWAQVNFELNGGSFTGLSWRIVFVGGKIVEPENPQKNCFDFSGWYTSDDEGETLDELWDFDTGIVPAGTTLYVNWVAETHTFGDWVNDADSGNHKRTCSICGESETAAHVGAWVTVKEPTCAEEGTKELRCTVCSWVLDTGIISVQNHTFGGWTDIGGGNHKRVCSACNEPETKAHTFGDWADKDGDNHKRTCSACDKEETAAHTYNDGVVTPPTYTAAGFTTYTCTVCEYYYTADTVSKLTYKVNISADSDVPTGFLDNYVLGETLSTPVREGYTFGGWYKDAGFTQKVTSVSAADLDANGGILLYAKWVAEPAGLSGGAIAAIVIGGAVVVLGGGFCLYWFLIRKKKMRLGSN